MTTPQQIDILAVGAHPDDVEWGCGGIIASQVEAGFSAALLILTHGEAGTRGSIQERRAEAEAGARCLGASQVHFLDCGDGGLRKGRASEDRVMFALRTLRPRVVLAPPLKDRHPDHERAGELVRDACFYAGLVKRPAMDEVGSMVAGKDLAPHRPTTLMHYMLHDPFDPDLIVDCSSVWQKKVDALAAHRSQFPAANGSSADDHVGTAAETSATWISKRSFWQGIEGRARHYGQRIGVEFAEPLYTGGPLGLEAKQFGQLYL